MIFELGDKHFTIADTVFEVPVVETLQLTQTDLALHFSHAEVESDATVDVKLFAFHFQKIEFGFDIITVVAERTAFPSEIFVIGNDHTAFATGGEVFALAETEASDSTDGTGFFAFVNTAEALGAVFNHIEVVFFGNFKDGIHVGDNTIEVNDDDRFGTLSDRIFDFARIDQVIGAAVNEYRQSTGLQSAETGSNKTVGSTDDFITGADAETCQCSVQGTGSVGNADGMIHTEPFSPFLFEFHADFAGPVVDFAGFKDIRHFVINCRVELRPAGKSIIVYFCSAIDSQIFDVDSHDFLLLFGLVG